MYRQVSIVLYADCWFLCNMHRQVCIALCTMIVIIMYRQVSIVLRTKIVGHYALCLYKLV